MIDPRIFEEKTTPLPDWIGAAVVVFIIGVVFLLGVGVGRLL